MPPPVAAERRYLPGLDGLRAIAVLAVVAYHAGLPWAQGGALGVSVFFVLSGYLITDLLLAQRDSAGHIPLREFWSRRARRLFPALWLMLLGVVLWMAIAQPQRLGDIGDEVGAAFLYVSNWWYVVHHVSYFAAFGPPSPLGHLWSLGVEEQFYLVWPLALLVATRWTRDRRVLLLLTLLLALASVADMALLYQPAADPNRIYYGTDTRAFELLTGAALALTWPSSRRAVTGRARRAALESVGFLGIAAICVMVCVTNDYAAAMYPAGMVVLCVATAAGVAALARPATLVSRALSVAPLRWLGVRSYGIYLWHFPVIALTVPLVDAPGLHLDRIAMQLVATLVIAALSWRYVEEPIRRRGFRAVLADVAPSQWRRVAVPATMAAAAVTPVVAVLAAAGITAGAAQPSAQPAPSFTTSITIGAQQLSDAHMSPCDVVHPRPPAHTPPPRTPSAVDAAAVGDSVMIDLAPFLREQLPGIVVDGKVSRQMYELPSVLAQLRAEGALRHQLVIELGTNGPFDEDALVRTLQSLGPMQRILLVNTMVPRPWQDVVNTALQDVTHRVPHVSVVDWYSTSAGKPQWFYADGVHPNPDGARVMAALIARQLLAQPAAPQPTPGRC